MKLVDLTEFIQFFSSLKQLPSPLFVNFPFEVVAICSFRTFSSSAAYHGVDMIFCTSWYRLCSTVEYFVGRVIYLMYCKFLIDNIKGQEEIKF